MGLKIAKNRSKIWTRNVNETKMSPKLIRLEQEMEILVRFRDFFAIICVIFKVGMRQNGNYATS